MLKRTHVTFGFYLSDVNNNIAERYMARTGDQACQEY